MHQMPKCYHRHDTSSLPLLLDPRRARDDAQLGAYLLLLLLCLLFLLSALLRKEGEVLQGTALASLCH